MKRTSKAVELSKDDLVQLVGKEKAEEVMARAHRVKLRKIDLVKIEDRLNRDGMVVMKRGKATPTTWQFVGLTFVTISPRFNFERPEAVATAISRKRHHKPKTISEVIGGN